MTGLDANTLIVLGAVAVLAVLVLFVTFRSARGQTEINTRLSGLAERQDSIRDSLNARLQDQERAISERLEGVTRRVGASLESSTEKTGESLQKIRERLAVMDQAQKKITDLSEQMVGLENILANKQARGAFGEIQLRDLVETLMPPGAFAFQETLGNGKRADCLLRLPNPPGPIAIDAKFPLESWQRLQNATDERERIEAGRRFSADVLKHVRDIREKYIVPGETGDAALMFLPSESVYAELHANHANAVEQSFREKVYIVSPTTLWATLNTVRAVFRDVRMREQAHLIQKEVETMMADVGRLDDRVGKLASHFDQARRDIEQIQTSSRKISSRGEKISELDLEEDGGAPGKAPGTLQAPPAE